MTGNQPHRAGSDSADYPVQADEEPADGGQEPGVARAAWSCRRRWR